MKYCCEEFKEARNYQEIKKRKTPPKTMYFILVMPYGEIMGINYCPFCGAKLK